MVGRQIARSRNLIGLVALIALAGCNGGKSSPKLSAIAVFDADGTPQEGADVIVQNAAGEVVRELITDVSGRVDTPVPDSGGVTVPIAGTTGGLDTFTGLAPGTPLRFGGDMPTLGTVDVTLVDFAGASSYYLDNGCAFVFVLDTASPIAIQLTPPCATTMDVIATALDADGLPVAYATAVDHDPDNPLTLTNWLTDFDTLTVEASDAPAGSQTLAAAPRLRREGLYYTVSGKARTPIAPGGDATLDLLVAPGFGDTELTAEVVFDTDDSVSAVTTMVVLTSGIVTIPLSEVLLDASFALEMEVTQAGRPDVTWTGGDATADAILITADWVDGAAQGVWFLHAPPTAQTDLHFPAMPAGLLPLTPRATTSTFGGSTLTMIETDFTNSYDAYVSYLASNAALPAAYTIRTTTATR